MDQSLVGDGINLCVKANSFKITEWMMHKEMKL